MDADWRHNLRLSDRLSHLFNNKLLTDTVIHVGNDVTGKEIFNCHKLLLSAASPVFEAMFYGDLSNNDPVLITDTGPQAFRTLLHYIYTEKLDFGLSTNQREIVEMNPVNQEVVEVSPVNLEVLVGVMYLAYKYMITDLIATLRSSVSNILTPTNVMTIIQMAELHTDKELVVICRKIISKQSRQILTSSDFINAKVNVVKLLLSIDDIHLNCDACDIWEAVLSWSKAECDRNGQIHSPAYLQAAIAPLLGCVDFLMMTPEHFSRGPALSGALTLQQSHAVLMNLTTPGSLPLPDGFSKSYYARYYGEHIENTVDSSSYSDASEDASIYSDTTVNHRDMYTEYSSDESF